MNTCLWQRKKEGRNRVVEERKVNGVFVNYEVLEQAGLDRVGGWFGGGGHKWKSVFPSKSSSEYAVAWHSEITSLPFTSTQCCWCGETDLVLVLFVALIG